MNTEHHDPDFESLEPPLQTAVKAALAGPIPEDAVERVKVRAKQLSVTAVSPSHVFNVIERRWRKSRFIITGLAAAVALLVMATVGIFFLNSTGGRAFAQMIEKVKAANSVHFTTAHQFGKQPEVTGVMYLEGNRIRFEQFNGMMISVADFDQKQGLALNTTSKLAQKMDLDAEVVRSFNNPIDQLRRMKLDDAEQIGDEMLKGRRTQVFRLHKVDMLFAKGNAEMMVWVDMESRLPAKIEIRDRNPQSPTELRFDGFVWNEPLDARLFSLTIPDGFNSGTVVKIPKAQTSPKATYVDNPTYLTDGVLCRDRVPARIVWDLEGKTIIALMQSPESSQGMGFVRENELRQWDVATGKLRWSKTIGGAGKLAQTADGKTLAIVIGYEVQLRDAASGKIMQKWVTDERLLPLVFSPDGKTLAAGIAEWGPYGGRGGKEWGGVQFWDVERANLVRSIKSDDKPVQFVRYSVDGKFLATSAGPSVKLWNVETGELARIFPGMHTADFSPDGKTIACQAAILPADETIGRLDLYNLQDGSLVKSFASDKGTDASWVTSITFSPDGRLLAATDWNGTVTLWDVVSGERKLTIADHKAGVLSAAFSPDGAILATGSEDNTLRLRKLPADLSQLMPEKK